MPYLNVSQVESALNVLSGPPNNTFTQLINLPHSTWEGRSCRALKIAGGPATDRIGVYFIGCLHAREWGSADILVHFIDRVTDAYHNNTNLTLGGKTFSAAAIKDIVEKLDILIFPQVNPDGRHYSTTADPMWRKNRRPALPGSTNPSCVGVDLNRNFDFLWNFSLYFHPSAGVVNSTNPCDPEIYIGPSAISEPETANVVWLFDNYPNIRFFIDVHSYTEKILYNWGDDQNQITDSSMNFQNSAYNALRGIKDDAAYREYIDACDQDTAIELATRMKNGIQAVRGKSYTAQSSYALYPTAGTSTDHAFSRNFVNRETGKVQSFVIEWGQEFQPPYSEMANIIQDITAGLIDFCLGILSLHADVYMKDNPADTGTVPMGVPFWHSPDLIIRQNDDNIFDNQPAQENQQNYVYVRFRNLGPADAKNVRITTRATRFPGTEFVYPHDWTVIDTTHLEPTPITDFFNNIPAGGGQIAKFSLSSAQVDTLWGWQTGGWHPCLLAEVESCNDYGSPIGVHVWQNNNLAQRNISVVSVTVGQLLAFPFVYGHPLNPDESLGLEIIKKGLPDDTEIVLDFFPTDPPLADIPQLVPLNSPRMFADSADKSGLKGCFYLVQRLWHRLVDSRATKPEELIVLRGGGDLVERNGSTLVALREPESNLQISRHPKHFHQSVLSFRVPDEAAPGDVYRIDIMQRNLREQIVGGVTLEVHVTD